MTAPENQFTSEAQTHTENHSLKIHIARFLKIFFKNLVLVSGGPLKIFPKNKIFLYFKSEKLTLRHLKINLKFWFVFQNSKSKNTEALRICINIHFLYNSNLKLNSQFKSLTKNILYLRIFQN